MIQYNPLGISAALQRQDELIRPPRRYTANEILDAAAIGAIIGFILAIFIL